MRPVALAPCSSSDAYLESAVDTDADRNARERGATPIDTVSMTVRSVPRFAMRARPTPSPTNKESVITAEMTRASGTGARMNGKIGIAAARKSATSIQRSMSDRGPDWPPCSRGWL
jgi:hypothetical protein